MNKYEAVIIFTDEFNDATAKKAIVKYSKILHKFAPKTAIGVDNIGKKRLAYPIREHNDGWYIIFKFSAKVENIAELERLFRIDDDVLKFIVVRIEDDDDEDDDDSKFETAEPESEQTEPAVIDAEDVLLGLATYN